MQCISFYSNILWGNMTQYFQLFSFIILLLILPNLVIADTELPDEKKKAIVYEMYRNYKKNVFPEVKDIDSPKSIELLKNKKIIFIDIRKKAEMEISMLPQAISKKAFLENPNKYSDKIPVAYCTISYRSGLFAQEMANKKIDVLNLSGGLLAWVLEGGRVYDHVGETKRIHVYGKKWNYPAKGYIPVMFGFFDKFF